MPNLERNFKTINQFRTISLLNVERKYSWQSNKADIGYLVDNKYIHTEGRDTGFYGCVEHMSVKGAKDWGKNFARYC